jgi:hypothetical protein
VGPSDPSAHRPRHGLPEPYDVARQSGRWGDDARFADTQHIPAVRSTADGPPRRPTRARALDRSRWHWLLFVPVLVALFPPLFNRIEPTFMGLPFYYWGQLAFALLACLTIAFVHLATGTRRDA